ncbi:GBF-interacting protein 1-like [Phoenix dactylifera]|uniref:GBF-interacting protein 1-like n=1 Tax=Phoenix dactylifera TaxID=42345 RepID=A0A8B7BS67_PHODC|nr:GBF-interacting protein 1-like [Phoenix dactylifera]
MVLGSRLDGGSQIVSVRIRKTIQSIKEIVGDHSDSDIYAMLQETNMDPNETAQKLLNQGPFHEVKRKRDKRKEHTGYMGSGDTKTSVEHNVQWTKSHASWDRNARRDGFTGKLAPGISREFRIVRDNRVNQSANRDVKPESIQHSAFGSEQVVSNVLENSSAWVPIDQKNMVSKNSEGHIPSRGGSEPRHSGADHAKYAGSGGSHKPLLPEETQPTVSTSQAQEVPNSSKSQSKLTSTNSIIGVCCSSSDPVHVPSPSSRSAGTVGAIQREIGAVGVRKQSSNHPTSHSSVSSGSFSVPLSGKDTSLLAKSSIQSAAVSKNNQFIQTPSSEPILSSTSFSRSFSVGQHHSRQPVGHGKAMQSNMEWKPKSIQKAAAISPGVIETGSTFSHADGSGSSNPADVPGLSEKLSQINILETQHVIIPQHLQVSESEHTQLTFGSFGAGFDSTKGFTSASQASENAQETSNEPTLSILATGPLGSSEDASAADQGDFVDGQSRTSQPDSTTSSTESEEAQPENSGSLSPHNIGSFEEIGLVQSPSPPYSSAEPQQLQNSSTLSSFLAYDPQMSYGAPFFRTMMEENVSSQGLSSLSEALNSHSMSSSSSSFAMVQQPPPIQPQQQPVAQLYPQVPISHYPNFVPYRHLFSPVYVPQMAMPNYSNNPAYPHPSNGNNYFLMPGANSHVTAGSMKYATSQYKPVPVGSPTGYGNYANPAGFTINSPGTIGSAAGLEDVSRIKYKDNSLYVPTPQAETSDIWIQTPQELSSLQSAPYYNLSGQAPHAVYMPTHAGHASFNAAAQSSNVQYPGLYHPPQPASVASPHQMVHQQVPSALGASVGVGVGVAPPGPQIGAYQQPQLSHLNWMANF